MTIAEKKIREVYNNVPEGITKAIKKDSGKRLDYWQRFWKGKSSPSFWAVKFAFSFWGVYPDDWEEEST